MDMKANTETGMSAEACIEKLYAATRAPGLECYMLIDCFVGYPFRRKLQDYGIASEDIQRLTVFYTAPGHERDPLLARLEKSELALMLLESAVDESNKSTLGPRDVCALIVSHARLPVLAAHIERRAGKHRMATGENTEFRFFDPRVMRVLEPMLDKRQRSYLFGPILLWAYVDEHGKCRIVEHHGRATIISGLSLTQIQEASLGMNIHVQRALQQLRKYRPDWNEDIPHRLTEYVADGICEEGLRDRDSIPAYGAGRWLIEHGHLKPEHLKQALEKHRATSMDIKSAIKILSPGVL
jgi:hypothetical protein